MSFILDDLKFEFCEFCNELLNASSMSLRQLENESDHLSKSTLSRIHQYDIDNLSLEKIFVVASTLSFLVKGSYLDLTVKIEDSVSSP